MNYGFVTYGYNFAWGTTSPCFTVNSTGGYTPANGDTWVFDGTSTASYPGNFSPETEYVSLNVSGNNLDLALASNPTVPVIPNASGNIPPGENVQILGEGGPYLNMKNPPAASTGYTGNGFGNTAADSYCMYFYSAMAWATAAGATGYGTLSVQTTMGSPDCVRRLSAWKGPCSPSICLRS